MSNTITVNGAVFELMDTHPAVPEGSPCVSWYRNGGTILSHDEDEDTWCACVADVAFFEEYPTAESALFAIGTRAQKYAPVIREFARLAVDATTLPTAPAQYLFLRPDGESELWRLTPSGWFDAGGVHYDSPLKRSPSLTQWKRVVW